MKFKMVHENYNVKDLDASLAFYKEALGLTEVRRINAADGSFIIVFLANDESDFELELTWLRDMDRPYDPATAVSSAFKWMILMRLMPSIRKWAAFGYENPSMGIYFITDPDGYWLEIIPTRK